MRLHDFAEAFVEQSIQDVVAVLRVQRDRLHRPVEGTVDIFGHVILEDNIHPGRPCHRFEDRFVFEIGLVLPEILHYARAADGNGLALLRRVVRELGSAFLLAVAVDIPELFLLHELLRDTVVLIYVFE